MTPVLLYRFFEAFDPCSISEPNSITFDACQKASEMPWCSQGKSGPDTLLPGVGIREYLRSRQGGYLARQRCCASAMSILVGPRPARITQHAER